LLVRPDQHLAWLARDAAQIDLDLVTGHLSTGHLSTGQSSAGTPDAGDRARPGRNRTEEPV
jgi:hypothetical protein